MTYEDYYLGYLSNRYTLYQEVVGKELGLGHSHSQVVDVSFYLLDGDYQRYSHRTMICNYRCIMKNTVVADIICLEYSNPVLYRMLEKECKLDIGTQRSTLSLRNMQEYRKRTSKCRIIPIDDSYFPNYVGALVNYSLDQFHDLQTRDMLDDAKILENGILFKRDALVMVALWL